MYFMAIVSATLLPDFVCRFMGEQASKNLTLAFSNTPGILKPVGFNDVKNLGFTSFVIPSNRVAICISIISYADDMHLGVTGDSAVISKENTHAIADGLREEILSYIEFSK